MIQPRPGSFEKCLVAVAFAACIGADLVLARAHMPNSDTVQTLLEATSALRHNVLLNHWLLGIDSFYFTDLPFMLIPTALFGPRLWLIYAAPVLVFAFVLLAALLLVARAAPAGVARWPGACAVLLLLGLPFTPAQSVFLVAAIHVGTVLLCLLALLIIQPALSGRRLSRALLPLFWLLLFMAGASDPQADVLFIVPLLLLLVLRLWLWPATRSDDDALIFAGALSAGVAAALWPGFISHHDGYASTVNFLPGFVPDIGQAAANALAVWQSLRLLMAAHAAAIYGVTWPGLLAATRLITLCAVLALCLRAIWRLPRARDNGVAQLLVLGALCLFGADVMSQGFGVAISGGPEAPGAAIRYVSPGFVLLVIAAICEAQNRPAGLWWRRAFGLVAALFCAVFLLAAARVIAADSHLDGNRDAPQYPLTQWLERRDLRDGVSDYWSAQMITVLSQGRIAADGVIAAPDGLIPYTFLRGPARIKAGRQTQFAVIPPPNSFGITLANITATYGPPSELDRVGPYQIAILPAK